MRDFRGCIFDLFPVRSGNAVPRPVAKVRSPERAEGVKDAEGTPQGLVLDA